MGNQRATKHGLGSELTLGPRREAHLERLRGEYQNAAETLLIIQASRLARIEVLTAWLDAEGLLKRGKGSRKGELWAAVSQLGHWERAAEQWIKDRREEEQARRDDPMRAQQALRDELARIVAARDEPKDAEVVEEEGDDDAG